MARYTTDVVCSIFMGVDSRSLEDPNSTLMDDRKEKRIVRNDVVDLPLKSKESQLPSDVDFKQETENQKAVTEDKTLKLTNDLLASQLISFVGASFETSSSVLYSLYELARNVEVQEEVRQHVRQVLRKHGGQPTYEALNEMTDLTNVVNEALRMYPPVSFLDREAARD
ncbi:cytochrome P450 6B4-like [Schistocerca gregaria]|uniref:cytochrome P450 6B4-like n=1 Tax=Schistocerca gregaria TaxID=7010 RepID=UPI00211E0C92|nr:cytochrome P450 6B4-like [Schistocerca gregaria]